MSKVMYKGLVMLALSLLLGLGLLISASAQVNPFEGQTDLTDAEAKKYVKCLGEMIAAGNDQGKIMDIMNKSGMDQMRFAYVTTKFNAAMSIIKDGDAAKDNIPPTVMPTDAEIAIVKKYEGDFDKIAASVAKQAD